MKSNKIWHLVLFVFFNASCAKSMVLESDCKYYNDITNNRELGILQAGTRIYLGNEFVCDENKDGIFNITFDFNLSNGISGFINAVNLENKACYPIELMQWFGKTLTRSYYSEKHDSVLLEKIYEKEYKVMEDEGLSKNEVISLMNYYFSEKRMYVSPYFFAVGDSEYCNAYKVLDFRHKGNVINLLIIDVGNHICEIDIQYSNSSVSIVRVSGSNDFIGKQMLEYALGIEYVEYDSVSAKKLEAFIRSDLQ